MRLTLQLIIHLITSKIPFVIPTDDDLYQIDNILNEVINGNEVDITEKIIDLDSIYERIYYEEI